VGTTKRRQVDLAESSGGTEDRGSFRQAQTTRFKIQGVITKPEGQIVLVDTPGDIQPGYELNRRMMAAVQDALLGVDLVCLIRDAAVSTGNGDRFVLDLSNSRRSRRCYC